MPYPWDEMDPADDGGDERARDQAKLKAWRNNHSVWTFDLLQEIDDLIENYDFQGDREMVRDLEEFKTLIRRDPREETVVDDRYRR